MDSFARNIFVACLFVIGTHGIRFNMEGQTRCFRDEVQANQLIALEFELEDVSGQQIDYVVSEQSLPIPFFSFHLIASLPLNTFANVYIKNCLFCK